MIAQMTIVPKHHFHVPEPAWTVHLELPMRVHLETKQKLRPVQRLHVVSFNNLNVTSYFTVWSRSRGAEMTRSPSRLRMVWFRPKTQFFKNYLNEVNWLRIVVLYNADKILQHSHWGNLKVKFRWNCSKKFDFSRV